MYFITVYYNTRYGAGTYIAYAICGPSIGRDIEEGKILYDDCVLHIVVFVRLIQTIDKNRIVPPISCTKYKRRDV